MGTAWEFDAELWLAEQGTWVFLTLPADVDEDVRLLAGPRGGFGSVRVEVSLGPSTWRTSVFPSAALGFVLPVKKAARDAAGLDVGDVASVVLRLVG